MLPSSTDEDAHIVCAYATDNAHWQATGMFAQFLAYVRVIFKDIITIK